MMVFGLPILLTALGVAAPDVRGDGDCPSAQEVAARLRPLLPPGVEVPPDSWLELTVTQQAASSAGEPVRQIDLRMLTTGVASPIGARRLASNGSCAEAAEAVAVVAASWLVDYSTTPAPPLWLPAAVSPAAGPAASTVLTRAPRGAARPAGTRLAFDFAAGAGMTTAAVGTGAPFLTAEVDMRRSGSASAARLVLLATGARTVELGSGTAAWQRLVGGVGVARGWGAPAAFLQIGIDALAGATLIDGRGFARSESTTSLDVGGGPSVRAGAGLAALPVTVWASAGAIGWLREQRVRVDGI